MTWVANSLSISRLSGIKSENRYYEINARELIDIELSLDWRWLCPGVDKLCHGMADPRGLGEAHEVYLDGVAGVVAQL